MDDVNIVKVAYGLIDDVKLQEGNWSVKVIVVPQPPYFSEYSEPLRYGNWRQPTPENPDGYGEWIPLGETPEEIALNYGEDIKGKFVEIRYRGHNPWEGRAYIVNQPSTEQPSILEAPERGPARILSAIDFII